MDRPPGIDRRREHRVSVLSKVSDTDPTADGNLAPKMADADNRSGKYAPVRGRLRVDGEGSLFRNRRKKGGKGSGPRAGRPFVRSDWDAARSVYSGK